MPPANLVGTHIYVCVCVYIFPNVALICIYLNLLIKATFAADQCAVEQLGRSSSDSTAQKPQQAWEKSKGRR